MNENFENQQHGAVSDVPELETSIWRLGFCGQRYGSLPLGCCQRRKQGTWCWVVSFLCFCGRRREH